MILAATGEIPEPKKPDAAERTKLRLRALPLFRSALPHGEATKRHGRFEEKLADWNLLTSWRKDAELVSVCEPGRLGVLPVSEQAEWRKLWADVDRVLRIGPTLVHETVNRGTLTHSARERTLDLKLLAGQTCVVNLQSGTFGPEIQLMDARGNLIAVSIQLSSDANVSQLIHTSKENSTVQIIATSIQLKPYVITINTFGEKAN